MGPLLLVIIIILHVYIKGDIFREGGEGSRLWESFLFSCWIKYKISLSGRSEGAICSARHLLVSQGGIGRWDYKIINENTGCWPSDWALMAYIIKIYTLYTWYITWSDCFFLSKLVTSQKQPRKIKATFSVSSLYPKAVLGIFFGSHLFI